MCVDCQDGLHCNGFQGTGVVGREVPVDYVPLADASKLLHDHLEQTPSLRKMDLDV